MFRTLDRYIIREVMPPFVLAVLIFTFLLELPPIMDQLERLVARGVPWRTAGHILLLLAPQALGITIPMGLLVGLLIGLGRMSSDREGVALLACGVSPYRLLRPVMTLGVLASLATLYVMIQGIPDANQRFREITFDIISKKVETDVAPRVFFEDFPNLVLYPRDEPPPGQSGWKDVLVADTRQQDTSVLYLAERGRLVVDRGKREVQLVLGNGRRYSTRKTGEAEVYRFPGDIYLSLDPDTVFPPMDLPRGVTEKTVAELQQTVAEKRAADISPHNEIMAIHAKFSIPAACLVFAVIALALGLTVARDGKFAGFTLGIAVIFAYYVVMFLSEAAAKGFWMPAWLARWMPNLVLGPVGVAALVWRARFAEGRLPLRLPSRLVSVVEALRLRWQRAGDAASPAVPATAPPRAATTSAARSPGGRVVIVVRFPRFSPAISLIDRYIARTYLRVAGLAFVGLLGLFYISTFIDRSDKIFKGQATAGMVGQLLVYLTPQFVYYVIPIATLLSALVTFGLLTRSSELTVLKACGVSLYRAAASLIVLSLGFSAVLFGLEQQVIARANRRAEALDNQIRGRPPQTFSALNRRWVVGRDGAIYHYGFFDPERLELIGLNVYRPQRDAWALQSQLYIRRAAYGRVHGWMGDEGWMRDFSAETPRWRPLTRASLPGVEPPDYFAGEQPIAELMTVEQLRQYIAELSASGFNAIPLAVELQKKLAFPFVTFVMTLLAVPFGVSTGRRGTLYGIGLGIVIALSYWIITGAFIAVGKAGLLGPVLAAWTPNVLVLGLAGYLFLRART